MSSRTANELVADLRQISYELIGYSSVMSTLSHVVRLALVIAMGSFAVSCGSPETHPPPMPSPQDVVNELLAADRAASEASAKTTVIAGLTTMFAQDVVMPAGGSLATGLAAVRESLGANPDNATAMVDWAPVRAGVSADGLHGFTFGLMTMHLADGATRPMKYLSYWVKREGRWQVAAYKRGPRPDGEVPGELMAAAMPSQLVPALTDQAAVAAIEQSLVAAEQAFSDEAQLIGLGPAFAKNGSTDAMNMGGPGDPGFVIGAEAISRAVTDGQPYDGNPFNWSSERVVVASSGDLGVSIGFIRRNPPAAGAAAQEPPGPFPFFTIWRRSSPTAPWRYIAE